MITPQKKQLNLLGLATRARLLISGEEQTVQAIQQQRAVLVVVATNSSANTQKKISDKCNHYTVPYLCLFTAEEISQAIGKKRSIVAFLDKGFADSFLKLAEMERSTMN